MRENVKKAAQNLKLVNEMFEQERAFERNNADSIPDHTIYGLMIANGFRASFPTFIDRPQCKAIEESSKSYAPNNVKINDLFIENLTNKVEEVVNLGNAAEQWAGENILPLQLGLFGTIPFEEFFISGSARIELSPYLKVLLFTIRELQAKGGPQILSNDFINGVLDPIHPTFDVEAVIPLFGNMGSLDICRGIFGASIYCPKDLKVEKIRIRNIKNLSSAPISSEGISGIGLYPKIQPRVRTGASSWGILLNNVTDSQLKSLCVRNIRSEQGRSFGVHFSSESQRNIFSQVYIRKVVSNEPSLGMFFQDLSFNNTITDCIISRTDIGIGADNTSKENTYDDVFVDPQ